jgi:hypothetical protein
MLMARVTIHGANSGFEGHFDSTELRANILGHSLDKLLFLLQRFLWTRIQNRQLAGSLGELTLNPRTQHSGMIKDAGCSRINKKMFVCSKIPFCDSFWDD